MAILQILQQNKDLRCQPYDVVCVNFRECLMDPPLIVSGYYGLTQEQTTNSSLCIAASHSMDIPPPGVLYRINSFLEIVILSLPNNDLTIPLIQIAVCVAQCIFI